MQRTIFILAYFLICVNCFSQSPTFSPSYNFKHITVQNGLTQNIVYHFLQDDRGYMWIGTHNGLNLYDGTRIINFFSDENTKGTIGGEFITSLLEDSLNRIWIGNEGGIDLYNSITNSFTHFGIDRPDGTKENTYCVALGFINANELWLLETKTRSIRSLNIKANRTSFIANINASHAQMYKGSGQTIHLWSAYDKGTIHQVYKNSKLISEQTYFGGKQVGLNTPVLEVIHILQQNDSTVWLSTNKGLVKLDPLKNTYRIFNEWNGHPVNELRCSAFSAKGQLWVATGPGGVYVFDTKTNKFIENYRNDKLNPFSICSDNIVSMYFDKTGNFWCGSWGNGASYTNTGNKFFSSHISKSEMQSLYSTNYIFWFGADRQGNIWCTFDNIPDLLVLDKNLRIKKYNVALLENGSVFDQSIYKLLFESSGKAWVTSNKGLYLYDPKTNKMKSIQYPLLNEEVQGSIWIRDIIRLNDGSILFSTFWGLYRITNTNGDYSIAPINFQKPGSYIGYGTLFQDENNLIYIKSLVDSLYILKPTQQGKNFELVKEMRFAPFLNQFFGEKNDSVVYFSTSDGVYHINKTSLQVTKDQLPKIPFINISRVYKLNNRFWVFGDKGLYYFDRSTNEARTFTVEDGLPANEFTLSGLEITNDRRCIAGTSNGLVSFYYEQKPDSIYPSRPQLTSIFVNDTVYTRIINPNETDKINLSYKENTFSFNFSPITFQHIGDYFFEYKLDNYDEDWIRSGKVNYTRYSKIPPGNYTFNLRVADAMGRLSPFTKTLEIEISNAFWQTIAFKVTVLLFILFFGWLFSRWFVRNKLKTQKLLFEKQQAIEKERTRIATDMHDDLGAGLSRIKFLSETIGIKKQQQQSIDEEVSSIRNYSHEMIDKMGEIVWALNEKNDSLSDLLSYTRAYTMEYMSQNGIKCKTEMPASFPAVFVSGEFRRNVFLTIKEALHNVVKHSQATEITLSININHKLSISLKDNGTGFDNTNIRPFSNGLINMHSRVKEIGGKIEITNRNGTLVSFSIPLKA